MLAIEAIDAITAGMGMWAIDANVRTLAVAMWAHILYNKCGDFDAVKVRLTDRGSALDRPAF